MHFVIIKYRIMKKVVVVIVFLGAVCAYAQSFKLYELSDNGEKGAEIANGDTLTDTCKAYDEKVSGETYAVLENLSNEDKTVVCTREIIYMIEDAQTYFCWGNCYPPDVSIDTARVRAADVYLFSAHYTAPIVVGSSIVRYVFYDADNREDSVSLICEYLTPPGTSVPLIVANNSLSVYPNPTNDQLKIKNYELKENENIEIYDVMGQKLYTSPNPSKGGKSPISFGEGQGVRLDVSHLANGVYFLKVADKVVKFVKE